MASAKTQPTTYDLLCEKLESVMDKAADSMSKEEFLAAQKKAKEVVNAVRARVRAEGRERA